MVLLLQSLAVLVGSGSGAVVGGVTICHAAGDRILFPHAMGTAGAMEEVEDERLRAKLEQTDEVIDRAADALRDCHNIAGQKLLNEARELQSKAWEAFRGSTPGGDALARQRTENAKKLALRALDTCRSEENIVGSLENLLSHTRDLVSEVRSRLAESPSVEGERLLEAGVSQLEKAESAYRAARYREAISHAGAARNLLLRAMNRAMPSRTPAASDPGPALARTDDLIGEVASMLREQPSSKAEAFLRNATSVQEEARRHRLAGRPAQALRSTERARDLALEALWVLERMPDRDRAARAIEAVDLLWQDAAASVDREAAPEAAHALDLAVEQLAAARRALAAGEISKAVEGAKAAEVLVRRSVRQNENR